MRASEVTSPPSRVGFGCGPDGVQLRSRDGERKGTQLSIVGRRSLSFAVTESFWRSGQIGLSV